MRQAAQNTHMTQTVTIPETEKPNVQFEYTDTFGGEANYSWVKRKELRVPDGLSELALVRRAKAWAGLTGVPCRRVDLGDLIALYPHGSCTVLFIQDLY
jgi:hypothetical protein